MANRQMGNKNCNIYISKNHLNNTLLKNNVIIPTNITFMEQSIKIFF